MATADYTFFTYGDVDGMYGMLNGVVMLMGSSAFDSIVRLMVLLGGVIMMLFMAGAGIHAHRGWKWLVSVAILSSALFGPKSTVAIEDATGVQAPAIVQNVPTALGFFFGIKSAVGQKLTELAETAFQTVPAAPSGSTLPSGFVLPSDLAYSHNGMMFGARVVQSTRSAQIIDPVLRNDLGNYLKDCVIPSVGRLIPADELASSTNLWATMKNTNKAFFTRIYLSASKDYSYMSCDDAWTALDGQMGAAMDAITKRMGAVMFPGAPTAQDAMVRMQSGILASYGKAQIGAAAADANALILQNAAINALAEASGKSAAQFGDMSAVLQNFAKQQSAAQVNASLMAQGETVGAALPMVKNILDMMMIAAFPIVCLLLIASEGQMMRTMGQKYILAMVWTELWPFFYAVVSFIGSNYAAHRAAQLGSLPTGSAGMALLNADAIYSGTISDLAMVGWAMTLVPIISGALVFGFDRMVTSSSGINSMGAQAGATAGNAATGSASGGQVTMDKYDMAYTKSDPAMMRVESVTGTAYGDANNPLAGGNMRWDARTGSSPVSLGKAVEISNQFAQRSSAATREAEDLTTRASSSIQAARSDAIELAKATGNRMALERLSLNNWEVATGLTASQTADVSNELMKKLGISATEENARTIRGQLQAGVGFGKLSAAVQSMGSNSSKEQIGNAVDSAIKTAEAMRKSNEAKELNSIGTGIRVSAMDDRSKALRDSFGAKLDQATGLTRDANASLSRAKDYSEIAEAGKRATTSLSFNFARAFNEYAYWKTHKDPTNLSDQQLQELAVDFFKNQTVVAHNDDGAFLAPNVFQDVMRTPMAGMNTTRPDQFSGEALEDRYKARTAASGAASLGAQTEIPRDDPNRASIAKADVGNRAAVTGKANQAGVNDSGPQIPENVLPLPPLNQSNPPAGPASPGAYLPQPSTVVDAARNAANKVQAAAEGTREQIETTRDGALNTGIGSDRGRMWTPTPTSKEAPTITAAPRSTPSNSPAPESGVDLVKRLNQDNTSAPDSYEARVNRINQK